jgi:hypothetical protein
MRENLAIEPELPLTKLAPDCCSFAIGAGAVSEGLRAAGLPQQVIVPPGSACRPSIGSGPARARIADNAGSPHGTTNVGGSGYGMALR